MPEREEIRAALDTWMVHHLSSLNENSQDNQYPGQWSELERIAGIDSGGLLGSYYARGISYGTFMGEGTIQEHLGFGVKHHDGKLVSHEETMERIVDGLVAFGTELDTPENVCNTYDAVKVYLDLYFRDKLRGPRGVVRPHSEEAVNAWRVCEDMADVGDPGIEDPLHSFEIIDQVLIIHRNQLNPYQVGEMVEELEEYASSAMEDKDE